MNGCDCLGPAYGEPYCICQMELFDIPLNTEARAAATVASGPLLASLYGPGGIFEPKQKEQK